MDALLAYIYLHAEAFASFGALAASLSACYASIRNGNKINNVSVSIDGRLTQLLEANKRADQAEGKEVGRVEEVARVAAAAPETGGT